jgi:hypothetical protein
MHLSPTRVHHRDACLTCAGFIDQCQAIHRCIQNAHACVLAAQRPIQQQRRRLTRSITCRMPVSRAKHIVAIRRPWRHGSRTCPNPSWAVGRSQQDQTPTQSPAAADARRQAQPCPTKALHLAAIHADNDLGARMPLPFIGNLPNC